MTAAFVSPLTTRPSRSSLPLLSTNNKKGSLITNFPNDRETALKLGIIDGNELMMGNDVLSSLSTSLTTASAATTSTVYSATHSATTAASQATEFGPILPDPLALVGIGAVLLLSAAAAYVWANEVVPTSRTKLALSKRQGEVKEYLDQLEADTTIIAVVGDANDDVDGIENNVNNQKQRQQRQLEQWLFTDWLEQRKITSNKTKGGRQKEPALPILKKAKWNSGDNPILVATALITICVIFASITEQMTMIFS